MTWPERFGLAQYYRGKGQPWLESIRQWIVPVMVSGAGAKYLGLPGRWALVAAVAIPLVSEGLAVLLGWLEHRTGATEVHYQAACDTDPFKRESLTLLREIRDRLAEREIEKGGGTG